MLCLYYNKLNVKVQMSHRSDLGSKFPFGAKFLVTVISLDKITIHKYKHFAEPLLLLIMTL